MDGGSLLLMRFLLVCLPAVAVLAGEALAERAVSVYPQQPLNKRIENNLNKRAAERRDNAASRRNRKMRQFKDSDGHVTLTNVPEKYERRKGFVEVDIR
jgi:hypothetical protein